MTGGQHPEGRLDVASLTRWLGLEGVRRVVITTPEPEGYRAVAIDPIASVRHRDDLADVQRELAKIEGVTVLIHDDRCATEERRLRKRGKLQAPKQRVWINERVCEGCGDCGEKSTCLSVQPVDTEFGRKTQIHQASCAQDFTCLKGDCPSFAMITPKGKRTASRAKRTPPPLGVELPEPRLRVPADRVLIRMPGIGGTGVVTVSQILQMAAHLDGRFASGLEQTGLAQKGGPVLSDVHLSTTPIVGQLRASAGSADVLLGLDLLGAAAASSLLVADPERTVAIVNTAKTPTASMVTDTGVRVPEVGRAVRRIAAATREAENVYLDAQRLAERLFGDHLPTNLLVIGAAYQNGCLPLSAEAIEGAIRLNGAAVEANLAAFRWGRAAVVDPGAVEAAVAPAAVPQPPLDPRARALVDRAGADGELLRLLEIRVPDLVAYQDARYARRYVDAVARVAAAARERAGDAGAAVAEAYARGLHKLMAYKDEYEVARLHLDAAERARIEDEFGADVDVKLMLHPPVLRAMGMKRKIALGASARPALAALRAGRRLRGSPFDVFGRAGVRRVERELVEEYTALVDRGLDRLAPDTAELVAQLADLPDVIRGYEDVKLRNVATFRRRAQELLAELESPGPGSALRVVTVDGAA
jgi:indolepyruvate ferredoxin oxidoreductase